MATIILALLLIIVAAVAWSVQDYSAWKALGPGGLPHTVQGWMKTTRFRLKGKDPIETVLYQVNAQDADNVAYLSNLPARGGPRPRIGHWPIPHRQLNQFISTASQRELAKRFDAAVARNVNLLHFKKSFYETHNPAITLLQFECGHRHAQLGKGEIAHIHPGDGSMHMIFSANDARTVIEAGWGERHPLAGVRPHLPNTYLYIYPPRDAFEMNVITQLLDAAISHMAGAKGEGLGKPPAKFIC